MRIVRCVRLKFVYDTDLVSVPIFPFLANALYVNGGFCSGLGGVGLSAITQTLKVLICDKATYE